MKVTFDDEIGLLYRAAQNYSYPCCAYDFARGLAVSFRTMKELETFVRDLLLGGNVTSALDGLSNVLYWGHATAGYRDHRVKRFRSKVQPLQLDEAISCFANLRGTGITRLKKLRLPQFSNLSFLSKLRTFLDPDTYVVIDRRLMGISRIHARFSAFPTYIPVSTKNERAYE